eukprot:jgi/Undpi1/3358/HiC_scaffold_15.g06731.m1
MGTPTTIAPPSTAHGTAAAATTTTTLASATSTIPSTSDNQAATSEEGGGPSGVTVEVISPREAVLGLPVPDPEARCGFSVKWFQEENASVFDKMTVSLQSTVVLSNLTPKSSYIAVVRSTAEGTGDTKEIRFSTPKAEGNVSGEMTELSRLEVRVGRCLEVSKHPDADSLYVEKVDFGEEEPRTIVSGLVAYVTEDEMRGRMVLGLCNLPPRAMRGVLSAGMLLCASNDDHTRVDPLSPPEGAKVGELITFQGVLSAPAPPGGSAARAWGSTMEGMKTGGDGVGAWNGLPMETSAGVCTSSITGRVR